jgi:predicted NUDIX family NTP pyrophosphohydrolase
MEWPPRSGKRQAFPEIDRGAWFSIKEALGKIDQGQVGLIHEMVEKLEELTSP